MRAIVRLLGEAAMRAGGVLEKKRYVLDGLCELAGASEWYWGIFDRPPGVPGARALVATRRVVELPKAAEAAEDPPAGDEGPGSYLSGRRPGGYLAFERRLGEHEHSLIVLSKAAGERPYSDRERLICQLIFQGIPWLHFRQEQESRVKKKLSPRLQHVLDLLLLGLSRKEIANRTGVTMGTVNGYVRELYASHGVNGHSELMRLRLWGEGARS